MASRKEVLVLEDDADARALLKRILESAGFLVLEAEKISKALEICEGRIPHLVLVDIFLRDESGFDYIKKHQEMKKLRAIPLVIVTGLKDKPLLVEAISRGVTDFVLKPYDPRVLLRKVNKITKGEKVECVTIQDGEKAKAKLRAKGSLVCASEFAFIVEAPVKLAKNSMAKLKSPLIEEIQCNDTIFLKTTAPSPSRERGQYLNEILATAQKQDAVSKIRSKLKEWS